MESGRTPIVFVVGTTGVGKSKLGLELGRALDEEVISADSMQIYRTADLMTAKATLDEQAQVPHHMLDIVDLTETGYNVRAY
jgi:tRNA dimethylallyltransferase